MYDYTIVPAGAAGCVLANRPSADLNANVCLVEAGPKHNFEFIHTPARSASLCSGRNTGLRVIDASIMPPLNGSDTTAPTLMIVEKAAVMIPKRV